MYRGRLKIRWFIEALIEAKYPLHATQALEAWTKPLLNALNPLLQGGTSLSEILDLVLEQDALRENYLYA